MSGPVDRATELVGRWLAARTSRRGFLGRMARFGVILATGPTLVALLVRRAEARVCGQSGVTPKCATFSDCNGPGDVWGWCWYASPGCCANGGLKKICDCCTRDYPNVHGYCPSGTNVRCIVESCHSDPRVLAVELRHAPADDAVELALQLGRLSVSSTVWLADVDPLRAGVVAPLAAAEGQPLLLSGPGRLDPRIIREIQQRGLTRVRAVRGGIGAGALDEAARYVPVVVEDVPDAGLGPWSAAVGQLVTARTGARRAVAVDPTGRSAALAPAAAALAAELGFPLLVGLDGVQAAQAGERAPVVTWLVGPEAIAWRGRVAGGAPAGDEPLLGAAARALATRILEVEGADGLHLTLAPATADAVHPALAARPGVALLHPDGWVDDATLAWIRDHRAVVADAVRTGTVAGLGTQGIYEVQSALNHFDTHQLVGVSGQGLPVISQPLSERPLGNARIAGIIADPPDDGAYWGGRANPARRP